MSWNILAANPIDIEAAGDDEVLTAPGQQHLGMLTPPVRLLLGRGRQQWGVAEAGQHVNALG